MSSDGMRTRRRGAVAAIVAASLALVASGCSSSGSNSSAKGSTGAAAASGDKSSTVKISLTSDGCEPKPAKVPAGPVEFDVTNSGAGSVSEAELRTSDKAHILGEQENLTPGLSGGFSLTIRPGTPVSSLLTGVLGIQPFPVWIEVIAWLAYLVPMLLLVAWPSGQAKKPQPVAPAPATAVGQPVQQ